MLSLSLMKTLIFIVIGAALSVMLVIFFGMKSREALFPKPGEEFIITGPAVITTGKMIKMARTVPASIVTERGVLGLTQAYLPPGKYLFSSEGVHALDGQWSPDLVLEVKFK